MLSKNLRLIIGLATIIASILYILSDVLEILGGGFSAEQLWINYVAFLPITFLTKGFPLVTERYTLGLNKTYLVEFLNPSSLEPRATDAFAS